MGGLWITPLILFVFGLLNYKYYQIIFNFMWQNWVNGVLGLWVILMPFLALPPSSHKWLMVLSGVVIAVLAFWTAVGEGKSSSGIPTSM